MREALDKKHTSQHLKCTICFKAMNSLTWAISQEVMNGGETAAGGPAERQADMKEKRRGIMISGLTAGQLTALDFGDVNRDGASTGESKLKRKGDGDGGDDDRGAGPETGQEAVEEEDSGRCQALRTLPDPQLQGRLPQGQEARDRPMQAQPQGGPDVLSWERMPRQPRQGHLTRQLEIAMPS